MEGSTKEYEVDPYALSWTELQALWQGFVSRLIWPCVCTSTGLNTEVHSPSTVLVRGVLFQGCAWAWAAATYVISLCSIIIKKSNPLEICVNAL